MPPGAQSYLNFGYQHFSSCTTAAHPPSMSRHQRQTITSTARFTYGLRRSCKICLLPHMVAAAVAAAAAAALAIRRRNSRSSNSNPTLSTKIGPDLGTETTLAAAAGFASFDTKEDQPTLYIKPVSKTKSHTDGPYFSCTYFWSLQTKKIIARNHGSIFSHNKSNEKHTGGVGFLDEFITSDCFQKCFHWL